MARISGWLWIALAGVVLQFVALGSDFYVYEGETRDAWFGIAHASEFLLATGVITIVLTVLAAAGRSIVRGRSAGLIIAIMGTIASLHIGYRMVAPPFDFTLGDRVTVLSLFDSCLGYCAPSGAGDAELLPGIWIALVGCVLVAIGGWLHTFSRRAAATPANFWRAPEQPGLTPWLGIAGLGAVAQWVFGFTVFTFYINQGTEWSGWFPMPHTSAMVLYTTLIIVGLVIAAARGRGPMSPSAMGAVVGLLGFLAGTRIFYRIIENPFGAPDVEIGIGGYLSVASSVVIVIAGAVHAVTHRESIDEPGTTGRRAETTPGSV